MMVELNSANSIIEDVQNRYIKYRRIGKNRAVAIELIHEDYTEELQDEDDRLAVLMGLSLSLCKKRELFEPFASSTLKELRLARHNSSFSGKIVEHLNEIEGFLINADYFGDEATYHQTDRYVPDWEIGDLFAHTLTYPSAEGLGIMGWNILLYKVGEYADKVGTLHQLMYISLCPPNNIPSCEKEFLDLPFLRMMQLGDRSEYLAQMTIKSKKDETCYGLTKVGCYPDIRHPSDRVEENPFTSMPLQGITKHSKRWPGFEDQICRLYRKFDPQTLATVCYA